MGVPTDSWSFRELVWAADAADRLWWRNAAHALAWIVNSQPSFSKHRKPVHPDKINPYIGRAPRGVPLNSKAGERLAAALARKAERKRAKEASGG